MADEPRYRTLVETPEYQAQLDFLASRYSEEVLTMALTGVLWGIARNPEQYEKITWNIRKAQSRGFHASQPRFKIFFGLPSDHVSGQKTRKEQTWH